MIERVVTKELHACDICKRRVPATSSVFCSICKKEICCYCRIKLIRSKRRYPDSGYNIIQERIGTLCIMCAKKKLKMKIK